MNWRCHAAGLGLFLCWISSAFAELTTTRPFPGITLQHDQRATPEVDLFVVTVELTHPGMQVRVAPGGADPDDAGPWQTTLLPVRQIAEREGFDLAINASFFTIADANTATIPEERSEQRGVSSVLGLFARRGYHSGVWSSVVGWTMTDGKLWSTDAPHKRPALQIHEDGHATIDVLPEIAATARQIVAGNCFVLQDGQVLPPQGTVMEVRHPRTAIGVNQAGDRLVVLTVDGRRPGLSVGMSGSELSNEMLKLNCWDAINLDGGGSTTLVMRNAATGQLEVLNRPSDGHERPVADALGIRVQAP